MTLICQVGKPFHTHCFTLRRLFPCVMRMDSLALAFWLLRARCLHDGGISVGDEAREADPIEKSKELCNQVSSPWLLMTNP